MGTEELPGGWSSRNVVNEDNGRHGRGGREGCELLKRSREELRNFSRRTMGKRFGW